MDLSVTDNYSQVIDFFFLKLAFLGFEVKFVFSKYFENSVDCLLMVFFIHGGDQDVIHVYLTFSFDNGGSKDSVHHRLEHCGRVGEPKEHDSWLEKPFTCDEGSLVFIAFLNTNVVESPTNIHFQKYMSAV